MQLTNSTPLSISHWSLLAIGGMDKYGRVVTAINLYQPDSGAWVKVGDLPSPRYNCTCAVTAQREVLVAGGEDERELSKKVDFAPL